MLILGIESSSLVASVAIVTDETLIAEYTTNFKKTHSQTLLPMLDEIVKMTGIDIKEIDAIAVSCGPGSFTGLRIGAATAKGLGLALKKPLVSVPTLEATAFNLFETNCLICPIMDARRNQVYNGIYEYKNGEFKTVTPQRALEVEKLITELNEIGKKVLFLGDGVPVYSDYIKENINIEYSFAPAHLNRQRAGSVAALGLKLFKEGKTVSAANFNLNYLRKSQAERELENKEKVE